MNILPRSELDIEKMNESEVKADLIWEFARKYIHTDRAKAISYLQQLKILVKKLRYQKGMANFFLCEGMLFEKKGNYKAASQTYSKALKIYEKLGDVRGISSVIINTGLMFFFQNQHKKAEQHYKNALDLALKNDDTYIQSRAYANLSNVYTVRKQFGKALDSCQKTLDVLKSIGDTMGYARVMDNLGIIYKEMGEYPAAIKCHWDSYKIKFKLSDHDNCARSLGNIANVYVERKEYDKAIKYFRRAIELAEKVNVKTVAMECYMHLAKIFAQKKDYKNAFRFQLKFEKLNENILNQKNAQLFVEMDAKLKSSALSIENKELKKRLGQQQGNIYKGLYDLGQNQQMPKGIENLSKRELETLRFLSDGLTDRAIAEKMNVSVSTAKTHLKNIYSKMALKNRSEAIALTHRFKLFQK